MTLLGNCFFKSVYKLRDDVERNLDKTGAPPVSRTDRPYSYEPGLVIYDDVQPLALNISIAAEEFSLLAYQMFRVWQFKRCHRLIEAPRWKLRCFDGSREKRGPSVFPPFVDICHNVITREIAGSPRPKSWVVDYLVP